MLLMLAAEYSMREVDERTWPGYAAPPAGAARAPREPRGSPSRAPAAGAKQVGNRSMPGCR
mgnify:CR=1 FL=1